MATRYSPKIVTNGLVLCLDAGNLRSFDGAGTWTDLVGGVELTKENSPVWVSNSNLVPNNGYFSGGASDRYIQETTSAGITLTTQVTLCAWYRKTGNGAGSGNQRIVEVWGGSGASQGHALLVNDSNGAVKFWLNDNGNSTNNRFISVTTSATPADDVWHYLVGTYSSPALKIYIDGDDTGSSGSTAVTSSLDDINSICVGAYADSDASYHMDGDIAIVQIYNKALSAAEVKQNYNAQKGRFGK